MTSAFAQLMKLSQSQTAESEQAVQSQIESHRRQLEQRKREQDAKEKKEKELEAKLRMKKLEDMRREEERKKQKEEEAARQRKELERKEEQMRMALKYGPKKAASNGKGKSAGPSGSSGFDKSDFDAPANDGSALTREEKRERKLAAQLRRGMTAASSIGGSRRSMGHKNLTSLPDGRTVRRLPGGAVDITVLSKLVDPNGSTASLAALNPNEKSTQSTRERLAALPAALVKLNTVKRDLRTIDEVMIERAKANTKVLDGEEAKGFSDWFGKKKKEEQAAAGKTAAKSISLDSPDRRHSPPGQSSSASSSSSNNNAFNTVSASASTSSTTVLPQAAKPKPKPIAPTNGTRESSSSGSSFFKSINPKPLALGTAKPNPTSLKRTRSPSPTPNVKRRTIGTTNTTASSRPSATSTANSFSSTTSKPLSKPSATPTGSSNKQRRQSGDADMDPLDISNTIWSLFGKDKQRYTALDRFSDEEEDLDMEADARSVLKEEARSARLAMKEDEDAFAEEKRREEEKRRRKKEKERKEREKEKGGY